MNGLRSLETAIRRVLHFHTPPLPLIPNFAGRVSLVALEAVGNTTTRAWHAQCKFSGAAPRERRILKDLSPMHVQLRARLQ